MITFTVIDNKTGKYPDCRKIAMEEKWAEGLAYCAIEGFAITETGDLYLLDERGDMAYCPEDRFTVTIDQDMLKGAGKWQLVNPAQGKPLNECNDD